jgi:hypothetical protein
LNAATAVGSGSRGVSQVGQIALGTWDRNSCCASLSTITVVAAPEAVGGDGAAADCADPLPPSCETAVTIPPTATTTVATAVRIPMPLLRNDVTRSSQRTGFGCSPPGPPVMGEAKDLER